MRISADSILEPNPSLERVIPPCPVFGECGGCQHQDIPYEKELSLKEERLRQCLTKELNLKPDVFHSIVPSPKIYHYRHRLDLKLVQTRGQEILIGFSPSGKNRIVPVSQCPIAMKEVSQFIPRLKNEVKEKVTSRYAQANLVVKTGDDGRVFWGGVGRRSLRMNPQDYLWTEIQGRRIYYSLETFFQANLSILPRLIEKIQDLKVFNGESCLYDAYCGVGLFGFMFQPEVKKVTFLEDHPASIRVLNFNLNYHYITNARIAAGKVEENLSDLLNIPEPGEKVVLLDPPRKGLNPKVIQILIEQQKFIKAILYLSCDTQSLKNDLKQLTQNTWAVQTVIPFDFFPRTQHLEVLVLLNSRESP